MLIVAENGIDTVELSQLVATVNIVLVFLCILICEKLYFYSKRYEILIACGIYNIFLMALSNVKFEYMVGYKGTAIALISILLTIVLIVGSKKAEKFITENRMVFHMSIILLVIAGSLVDNWIIKNGMTISKNTEMLIQIFNAMLYLYGSFVFIRKGIKESNYVYAVIGSIMIVLLTQALNMLAYLIYIKVDIKMASLITCYIGFLVMVISMFVPFKQSLERSNLLEGELNLFYNIVEKNRYYNIVILDEDFKVVYRNKESRDLYNNEDRKSKIKEGHSIKDTLVYNIIFDKKGIEIEKALDVFSYWDGTIKIKEDYILDIAIQRIKKSDVFYTVITFKDITEKYKNEKAMIALESLKSQEKIKSEFLSNVSHELRTPITLIYSTVQLLSSRKSSNNFSELYSRCENTLHSNSQRMTRLVSNIVDITKFESGAKEPEFSNYDIVNIVEDITMSILNYSKMKDIDIIFDTDSEELVIKCDPYMIERVMLNLLSNSIKFTDPGGCISVTVSTDNKHVNISVKDNGIGIPIDKQALIFDRFAQVDKSLIRNNEGSGLGLSIVCLIVNLCGGDIKVISDGKSGTEFVVSLPNEYIEGIETIEQYNINMQNVRAEISDIYELHE